MYQPMKLPKYVDTNENPVRVRQKNGDKPGTDQTQLIGHRSSHTTGDGKKKQSLETKKSFKAY